MTCYNVNLTFVIEEYKREDFVINHLDVHCGDNSCVYFRF